MCMASPSRAPSRQTNSAFLAREAHNLRRSLCAAQNADSYTDEYARCLSSEFAKEDDPTPSSSNHGRGYFEGEVGEWVCAGY
jgi:hypothetical protein